jgi:hypothetical protein
MQAVTMTGNATLIAYDNEPILSTDPWMGDEDPAYFGSWILSCKIPAALKQDIKNSKYIWFSHGHPDHLNPISINRYPGKKILLPDHVNGRIRNGLTDEGFDVDILPDRKWVSLSENIRVQCITTVIQDAILLVDVCGVLFINLNDAGTKNCSRYLREIVKGYKKSYVMSLSGYGDADMINFYDESGNFVVPPAENNKEVGIQLETMAKALCATGVIPFSSFHQYQRKDSMWAQKYVTPNTAYKVGLSDQIEYVEPFSTIDCRNLEMVTPEIEKVVVDPVEPSVFGDDWSDILDKEDLLKIKDYFWRKERIRNYFGFINFRVGGIDNIVALRGKKDRGITFEVPRGSLMTAIDYRIFDDLLIGNFMKTTLHNLTSLYEGVGNFNFNVAKYGDNGLAESEQAIRAYVREYRRRCGRDFLFDLFLDKSKILFSRFVSRDSRTYKSARTVYRQTMRGFLE